MDSNREVIVYALGWILIGGVVGSVIGGMKGRSGTGFVLGALLGVIGWVIAGFMENRSGRQCRECQGWIPATARKCKHCGSEQSPGAAERERIDPAQREAIASKQREHTDYFLALNGKAEGPFTTSQIKAMFYAAKIDGSTLICREGEQEWSKLQERREIFA